MANNLAAAKQDLSDRLNAKVSTSIPFIQKSVNLGKEAAKKGNRTNGELLLYVPASGNARAGLAKDTMDISNDSGDSAFYRVLTKARNGVSKLGYNSFEEIFNIGDLDKDFVIPRGERLAHVIEKDLVERAWTRAGGAVVCNDLAAAGFGCLSKATATLQTVKAEGDWTGFIHPILQAELANLPTRGSFIAPDDRIRDMYGKASIGVYGNADWVNEGFLPTFTAGATPEGSTVGAVVNSAGALDEYTEITLNAAKDIKKGTPFTIEGVYDTTLAGVPLAQLKVFIAQEDNGNTTKVKVLPLYFNGTAGYTNNVWAKDGKIPSGAKIHSNIEADASYYTGFVRDTEAFNWTPYEMPELLGLHNATTSTDDLTIHVVGGGEVKTRSNVMRLDAPYFGDIVDPRVCRLILVKM